MGRYWHDAFVQIDDFKNEGVVASGSWPFQANTLIADKQPIATTVPKEGVTGWADTSMVHNEAKNLTCAYKWLEHSLNNKLQGDLASWFGSVPVVPAACEGNALLGERGVQDQRHRQLRSGSLLAYPRLPVQEPGNLCALLPLGLGLYRHPGWPLSLS